MNVREARPEEAYAVALFMKRFEECTSHVLVDPEYAGAKYRQFILDGTGAMLILEDDSGRMIGGLGCLKAPDLHYPRTFAVETFWYVAPEHRGQGVRLLDAFEDWASRHGCAYTAMIHLSDSMPDRLEAFYKSRGYALVEKHYVRNLEGGAS